MANFTQSAITDAFGAMLERMPFDKITVSGIIKECGISRNTFYYHFRDLYDLLDHWLDQEISAYRTSTVLSDWEGNIRIFLNNCKSRKKLIYNLANSISRERLERYYFSSTDGMIARFVELRARGKNIPPARVTAISNICQYACMGYFLRFLWNGMKEDTEEIISELNILFEAAVEHRIDEYEP